MEFLRVLLLCFGGVCVLFSGDFALAPIVIPRQKIQNFFSTKQEPKISLEMIMNKKAKINGKWYQQGDYVLKYQISEIKNNAIVLKKHSEILELSTTPQKSNLLKAQTSAPTPSKGWLIQSQAKNKKGEK